MRSFAAAQRANRRVSVWTCRSGVYSPPRVISRTIHVFVCKGLAICQNGFLFRTRAATGTSVRVIWRSGMRGHRRRRSQCAGNSSSALYLSEMLEARMLLADVGNIFATALNTEIDLSGDVFILNSQIGDMESGADSASRARDV